MYDDSNWSTVLYECTMYWRVGVVQKLSVVKPPKENRICQDFLKTEHIRQNRLLSQIYLYYSYIQIALYITFILYQYSSKSSNLNIDLTMYMYMMR